MLDFAWSEIGLIGVVALILIGPKDMPVAVKTVTGMIKKARRMASEFQTHVDDMIREADLGEVRDQIRDIRNLDIRSAIVKAVDDDGSIRRALNEDPFATTSSYTAPAEPATEFSGTATEVAVAERPETSLAPPESAPEGTLAEVPSAETVSFAPPAFAADEVPAFVPPEIAPRVRATFDAPAFVPPEIARQAARPDGPRPHA